jgi:hypothetical protein
MPIVRTAPTQAGMSKFLSPLTEHRDVGVLFRRVHRVGDLRARTDDVIRERQRSLHPLPTLEDLGMLA